jgi:hypothetical protein
LRTAGLSADAGSVAPVCGSSVVSIVRPQAWINFVGFGAEIVRHRDQSRGDRLVVDSRRYAKAVSGFPRSWYFSA